MDATQKILPAVLHSPGPAPELGDAAGLYDWLTGSWAMDIVDHLADGSRVESRGEWHFGWVLEGRAVQDVFIVPPRGERGRPATPGARNRYGASIRTLDARTGDWRITWINPVSGAEDRLVGRRVGDDIVQEGVRADGTRIRWSFTDITPDAFTWRGEASSHDGRTWRLEAEFFGKRLAAVPTG